MGQKVALFGPHFVCFFLLGFSHSLILNILLHNKYNIEKAIRGTSMFCYSPFSTSFLCSYCNPLEPSSLFVVPLVCFFRVLCFSQLSVRSLAEREPSGRGASDATLIARLAACRDVLSRK